MDEYNAPRFNPADAKKGDARESRSLLEGREVEIQLDGRVIDRGIVDAVTSDGSILWLRQDGAVQRRLIEFTPGVIFRASGAD